MANCKKIKDDAINEINTSYNTIISSVAINIEDYRKKGLDPRKYNPGPGKPLVDLIALTDELNERKKQNIRDISKKVDEECLNDNEETLQTLVDLAVIWVTDGISTILPKHMTHIDVKEILNGKPLGGKNSVVNKLRDDMLDKLGLDEKNDITIAIKDPVKTTTKVVKDILSNVGIHI